MGAETENSKTRGKEMQIERLGVHRAGRQEAGVLSESAEKKLRRHQR